MAGTAFGCISQLRCIALWPRFIPGPTLRNKSVFLSQLLLRLHSIGSRGKCSVVASSAAENPISISQFRHKNVDKSLEPGLYVVATPIGCLEDITLRALRVLEDVDRILCEDTRRTAILLNHYGIKTGTESYHLHNEHSKIPRLINELRSGAVLALVSDAGMPTVNDPGAQLIAAAVEHEIPVIPVPGPSALLTAIVVSGLRTSSFSFFGFIEAKRSARRKQLESCKGKGDTITRPPGKLSSDYLCREHSSFNADLESAITYFVSPHALVASLEDACEILGLHRRCCLARELTKAHEEVWRGTLEDALDEFSSRGPRGEFTMVIEGLLDTKGSESSVGDDEIVGALRTAMSAGVAPSQAAKDVSCSLKVPKKRAYALAIALNDERAPTP